jgi:hypothetical protein
LTKCGRSRHHRAVARSLAGHFRGGEMVILSKSALKLTTGETKIRNSPGVCAD